MITVSIILTTYNAEKTVERIIQSILNQEGIGEQFIIEWLVADDHSTDKTTAILSSLGIPFTSYDTNSGGPNKGRNDMLSKAKGDYIAIVDHDDEWAPNRLIEQLNLIRLAPIISCGYQIVNERTNKISLVNGTPKDKDVHLTVNETFLNVLQRNYSGQITYLGSLLFENNDTVPRFEEEVGRSDFEWILKLFENQESAQINKILYRRYVDGNNLSFNETYRKQDHALSEAAMLKYAELYPNEVATGLKNNHATLAKYYYIIDKMQLARDYFDKAGLNVKNSFYYLTTYAGSSIVKRLFKVFG